MGNLLGPGVLGGNEVADLQNGDQIFPAMLAAIRAAQRTVTFETYIYWSGDIGKQFADALSERARAGVQVHVLLDWVGSSKMEESYLSEMRHAGVQIEKFHKPHWSSLARLNNRTHRKLLILDGMVGFTGGVGIAPEWTGHAQDPDHWRDTHYRVRGPAVAQMQSTFLDNWLKVTGRVLHGDAYFSGAGGGGAAAGADVLQFAVQRQREHAAHVPHGDCRRRAQHRPVGRLLRSGRVDPAAAVRCPAARRAPAHRHARRTSTPTR